MSEPSPSAPGKAGPSKKPVSPARNAIGLVVLIAVVVVGYFEVSAKTGYNAAVNALDKRLEDEDHGLPTMPEAEKLIGKQADDAGSDYQEGHLTLHEEDLHLERADRLLHAGGVLHEAAGAGLAPHRGGREVQSGAESHAATTRGHRAAPRRDDVGPLSKGKVAKNSKKAKADGKKPTDDDKAKADEKKPTTTTRPRPTRRSPPTTTRPRPTRRSPPTTTRRRRPTRGIEGRAGKGGVVPLPSVHRRGWRPPAGAGSSIHRARRESRDGPDGGSGIGDRSAGGPSSTDAPMIRSSRGRQPVRACRSHRRGGVSSQALP